jgi:hypothetical protein
MIVYKMFDVYKCQHVDGRTLAPHWIVYDEHFGRETVFLPPALSKLTSKSLLFYYNFISTLTMAIPA